jgi:predicted N-acetyltransferase YhbS
VLGQPRFYGTFEFSGITPEQFEMLLEFERRLSEVKE